MLKLSCAALCVVALSWLTLSAADSGPRTVHVDASKVVGKIRSFQGVNNGPAPLVPGKLPSVTKQYKDLRIDLVRTHDFFGPGDIDAKWTYPSQISKGVGASADKCIFRDWNADPESEASYNFGPTDPIIQAIVDNGQQVFFRLGRSFGADSDPPPDFDKFANVSKHIAMHYNGGWAHGFHDNIRYWEVWNEPDVGKPRDKNFFPGYPEFQGFWMGTPAQYYDLYEKIARTLKSYDPNLKVGGPAKAGGAREGPYRKGFIEYCAAHKVPLDFYSWHLYYEPPTNFAEMVEVGKTIRQLLDTNGFTHCESIVSEWNLARSNPVRQNQGDVNNAAFVAAALIHLQDSAVDHSLFYRGDATGTSLFDLRGGYTKKAYSFKAAAAMLDTPERLAADGGNTQEFAVLAGRSAGGRKVQVLIANAGTKGGYTLAIDSLPWGDKKYTVKRYRVSATEDFTETAEAPGKGGKLIIATGLPSPSVELFVLEQ
jgi:hypothetical protein